MDEIFYIGETWWIPMKSEDGYYVAEAQIVDVCESIIILKINGGLFGFLSDIIKQIGISIFPHREDAEKYISAKRGGGNPCRGR